MFRWQVTLTSSSYMLRRGESSSLVAIANMDVRRTPFVIRIFDETNHTYIATCKFGRTCAATALWTLPALFPHRILPFTSDYYEALISDNSPNYPPGHIQASATIHITMLGAFIFPPRPPRPPLPPLPPRHSAR